MSSNHMQQYITIDTKIKPFRISCGIFTNNFIRKFGQYLKCWGEGPTKFVPLVLILLLATNVITISMVLLEILVFKDSLPIWHIMVFDDSVTLAFLPINPNDPGSGGGGGGVNR